MWRYGILCVLVLFLAACQEDERLVGDPIRSEPVDLFAPTQAVVLAGCETTDLENWYEVVSVNATSFRNESFGFAALSPEAAFTAVNRLSDLRDTVNGVGVPECATMQQRLLLGIMETTIEAFVSYSNGQLDQATLIERVTADHVLYDTEFKPQMDSTLTNLDQRLQEGR